MIGHRHLSCRVDVERFPGSRSHPLAPLWGPLLELVERRDMLAHDALTATVGSRIYVGDLNQWLRCYPPGSVEYDAVLLHERAHSVRQRLLGVGEWWRRYQNDPAFMWAEEQRGWYLQLVHLQANDMAPPATDVALLLAEQRNRRGPMVDFETALEWVDAVYDREWSPS